MALAVVCSSIHQKGKGGNFTLLLCRGRQGLVHKSVPHVQHIRPIKFLGYRVVVVVPVVDAKTP